MTMLRSCWTFAQTLDEDRSARWRWFRILLAIAATSLVAAFVLDTMLRTSSAPAYQLGGHVKAAALAISVFGLAARGREMRAVLFLLFWSAPVLLFLDLLVYTVRAVWLSGTSF